MIMIGQYKNYTSLGTSINKKNRYGILCTYPLDIHDWPIRLQPHLEKRMYNLIKNGKFLCF